MQKGFFDLPFYNTYSKHNGHIFFIILKKKRKNFINFFKKKGINCLFHYTPLHNSKAGRKFGISKKIKNTQDISNLIVRFPIFSNKKILSKEYFEKIKFCLEKYYKQIFMKKILFLGGGIHLESLAKEAKKRNLQIYLIDFVKEPFLKKYSYDFF